MNDETRKLAVMIAAAIFSAKSAVRLGWKTFAAGSRRRCECR